MSGNGTTVRRLRCAIYTRKSTEEGLDQDFNSLDAQYEACAAYIVSQASLGWKLMPDRYDDGGISGGTMERPALQRLLDDLRERRIDVVVVYKIDRLTRSLSDFARIVEIFDEAEASFVSVTQQFNTTTSMGRLTLNVLLSFAQFEREVTAERIRDKIAASKKKGMWMGGTIPLGYRPENRKLVIHQQEAEIVRFLFQRYLKLGSIRATVDEANAKLFPANATAGASDTKMGGDLDDALPPSEQREPACRRFSRGQVAHILSNPLYIGKVRHRDQVYEGEHEALVDNEMFERARTLLNMGAPLRRSPTNSPGVHLLQGLVFDQNGAVLRSTYANKKGVRYRYYVSKDAVGRRGHGGVGWRLPAVELERLVERELVRFLNDGVRIGDAVAVYIPTDQAPQAITKARAVRADHDKATPQQKRTTIKMLIERIDLQPAKLLLTISCNGLLSLFGYEPASTSSGDSAASPLRLECPMSLRRRGVETRLVINDNRNVEREPDPNLVSTIVSAHHYLFQLSDGSGRSLSEIAAANDVDRSDFARTLRLAFLSPKLLDGILEGTQPIELTVRHLSRLSDLPLCWSEQERLLGFASQ
ncbi:MAG: recombinase family protein [Rhizobiaceae bacterium]|nr:recombinase family protein [Rhizobiaceae bacterium]